MEWEKISATHISVMGLVFRIYIKNLQTQQQKDKSNKK